MTHLLPLEISQALQSMEDAIERIVVRACESHAQRIQHQWVDFEVRESFEELKRLRTGKDLGYDRPSIGIQYAYWYHLQRTHELVRILGPKYLNQSGELTVLDLGSGTGATAWALALMANAAERAGISWPDIRVIGVENSPFMLDMALELWDQFQSEGLGDKSSTSAEYRLGSWAHERAPLPTDLEDHLVVASYLFDASDKDRMEELAGRLTLTCRMHGYRHLLVTSAASKAHLVSTFGEAVGGEWAVTTPPIASTVWAGRLEELHASRGRFLESAGDPPTGPPTWSYAEPSVVEVGLSAGRLFQIPRTTLTYDPVQDKAAEPTERLTAIIGAAGSGKSRVLCERVVRTLETSRPPDEKHVLVTSFNKAMVDQLASWIAERLDTSENISRYERRRLERGRWEFTVTNAIGASSAITMMNRDKLPHRVFGVPFRQVVSTWYMALSSHRHAMSLKNASLVERVSKHSDEFLAAEYERIFLGEGPLDKATYVSAEFIRRGRGVQVRTADRPDVWDYLMEERPAHFVTRRLEAVERHARTVQAGERVATDPRYSNVFVDECQDFTPAETRLLARVPPEPQGLCVAGDETQSIHLGASYRRPGIQGAVWDIHRLEGSYRLPARVCEAIRPLAEQVAREHSSRASGADGVVPEMRKSASPGPRPVVVNGSSHPEHVVGAIQLLSRYVPDNEVITIVPGRTHFKKTQLATFRSEIEGAGFDVEVKTMLDIKGLEREFVVFPTDNTSHGDESTLEWVYTALTRSVGVVMIVLFENTPADTAAAISLLSPDHLLFWDSSARKAFDALGG